MENIGSKAQENKAIIFDLDGTLLDTIPDMLDAINDMLMHFNYPLITKKQIRRYIGNGARNLVIRSIGKDIADTLYDNEIDERLSYYNKVYTSSGSPKTKLFDGTEDFVKKVKALGYKIAILTNKPQMTTDDVYKTYLSHLDFDMVVGHREGLKIKPNKESALNILSTLNVKPENCFFLGDGETDVLTAINAGVKGIAVLWGYRDKEELEQVGAKTFAQNYDEVYKLILENTIE